MISAWLITLFNISSVTYADKLPTQLNVNQPVIIAHQGINTEELSLVNLRAIYTMRKRSWNDKTPIKVFVLPDQAPLHQHFCKSVLKMYPYVLRELWDRLTFSGTGIPPTVVRNEAELREIVRNTPGAIAYAPNKQLINMTESPLRPAQLFVNRIVREN
jgi:hypothetical protein